MKQGSLSAALLIVLGTQVVSAEDCVRDDLTSSEICKNKMGENIIFKVPPTPLPDGTSVKEGLGPPQKIQEIGTEKDARKAIKRDDKIDKSKL